jgi:uncharacterized membrane protein
VRVIATGGGVKAEAGIRLTVKPASPAPVLALELPDKVVIEPGRTVVVEVCVLQKGVALTAEPAVTVTSPDGRLKLTPWMASDFKPGATSFRRAYALRVVPDALPGEITVRVRASVDDRTAERPLKVTIPQPATKPAPELQLVLPEGVAVEAGRTVQVEVRVRPRGAAALTAEPSLTFTLPEGLKVAPWLASDFKADPSSSTRGYALRAAADAAVGEMTIRVRAEAAGRSVEGAFKITVRKSSR